jgi:two-component system, LytTR family, response regulator
MLPAMKLRALIADDEPLARERLRFLLAADDQIEIAGECRNGREVITALRELPVDVLFLDIQMPARGGFEVIEQVGAANMPATVFVTAHHHYAVQAFEVHALDYLTKPVEAERLRATLLRVRERIAANCALVTQEQLRSVLATIETGLGPFRKEYPARLLIPNGTRDSFVSVNEIDWIQAADYYSCLHVGARTLMLRETIKQLTSMLDPRKFVRIHRSIIVNIEQVHEIFREGRSEGAVVLHSGQRLKMSKKGWQTLIAASGKLP